MDILYGLLYWSLHVAQLFLPLLLAILIIQAFVRRYKLAKIGLRIIAFALAVALLVGAPIGLINLAYPKDVKSFEKMWKEVTADVGMD